MTSNHATAILTLLSCAAALSATGCTSTRPVATPPASLEEYDGGPTATDGTFPAHTVLLYNLQRTLDPDLTEEARLSSLALVDRLGWDRPEVLGYLAAIPANSDSPPRLRRQVAHMLAVDAQATAIAAEIDAGAPAQRPTELGVLATSGEAAD